MRGESDGQGLDARWLVYALIDPRDGRVRYIGRTFCGSGRERDHRNEAYGSAPKVAWVKELRASGLRPLWAALGHTHSFGGIRRMEKAIIQSAQKAGWVLVNGRSGGAGGIPEELRRRRRDMALRRRK